MAEMGFTLPREVGFWVLQVTQAWWITVETDAVNLKKALRFFIKLPSNIDCFKYSIWSQIVVVIDFLNYVWLFVLFKSLQETQTCSSVIT
jgi:hypothetical protein